MDFRKLAGIALLVVFSFVAASIICLASDQANTMDNCSRPGSGPSVCPFMSVSVPTVLTISGSMRQLTIMLAFAVSTVAIGLSLSNTDGKPNKLLVWMRQLVRQRLQGEPVDTVIALISRGVLHSRVFTA